MERDACSWREMFLFFHPISSQSAANQSIWLYDLMCFIVFLPLIAAALFYSANHSRRTFLRSIFGRRLRSWWVQNERLLCLFS